MKFLDPEQSGCLAASVFFPIFLNLNGLAGPSGASGRAHGLFLDSGQAGGAEYLRFVPARVGGRMQT